MNIDKLATFYLDHIMYKFLSIENVTYSLKNELIKTNSNELYGGLIVGVARDAMDIESMFIIEDMEKSLPILFDNLDDVLEQTINDYKFSGKDNFKNFIHMEENTFVEPLWGTPTPRRSPPIYRSNMSPHRSDDDF